MGGVGDDPLGEGAALVGGFWVGAGEGEEDAGGEGRGGQEQGEFLPMSPHERSVT